jgi:hypothetical protein
MECYFPNVCRNTAIGKQELMPADAATPLHEHTF